MSYITVIWYDGNRTQSHKCYLDTDSRLGFLPVEPNAWGEPLP